MRNNKGFTLVELLAVMIILGVMLMAVIPNISGISANSKMQAYAEDAKRFKNTVEYEFRSDSSIQLPTANNHCLVVNLKMVHNSEFESAPYGGKYDMQGSYVVIRRNGKQFNYYVQLIEDIGKDGTKGFRGYDLRISSALEGDKYRENFWEGTTSSFTATNKITGSTLSTAQTNYIKGKTGCTTFDKIYYEAP